MNKPGTVALVGSGEFLPPIEALDRQLLSLLGVTPHVVVLPTAAANDGPGVAERWAQMGIAHFTRLGASAEAAMVLTRKDAETSQLAEQISAANMVYLSGGKPGYLLKTLQSTACWHAIKGVFAAGGVVVGCSAGAMVLAGHLLNLPQLWRTSPGLALAPDFAVVPHFDEIPSWLTGIVRFAPAHVIVAGIAGSTALVGSGQDWQVYGNAEVVVFAHGQKFRYRSPEHVSLSR